MTFTNIYNQIDTQDDLINCDKFIDIDFDINFEDLELYDNKDGK
jgi:hypothetical protein